MPKAVCGVIVVDGKIVEMAPYLRSASRVTTLDKLLAVARRKGWKAENVPTKTEREGTTQ